MNIREAARWLFSLKSLAWYGERVCTVGCMAPLAHFVVLPFALCAYVVHDIFGSKYVEDADSGTVTFTVGFDAFRGFFWLMGFWTYAIVAAAVGYAVYRTIVKSFSDRPVPRILAKGMMAVFVTSGSVERLISDNFVSLPNTYAPKFDYSLYRDLGALVRSPMWDFGRYSFVSMYTWLPLATVAALFLGYLGKRIAAEVRFATRRR